MLRSSSLVARSAREGHGGNIPIIAVGKWFKPYAIDHALMLVVAKILKTNQQDTFHYAICLLADKINAENEASGNPVRIDREIFTKGDALKSPYLYKKTNHEKVVQIALEQRFSPEDLVRLGYRIEAGKVDTILPRQLVRAAITGNRPSPSQQARRGRAGHAERAGEAGDHEPGVPGPGGLAGSAEETGGPA